jgi:hypothetical protein
MNIFFKHSDYLYGLLLITIPIIVHLFNFRRYKTVYYSNIGFLKSIQEKSKSQSQLKHYLVLFSRIFFIISLVLIFAQPYLSDNLKKEEQKEITVSIYIDNSFSSGLKNENGGLLENYKKSAINVADAYKSKAKFLLLTNNMPSKFQHLIDYNNLINYISEISTSNKTKNIKEIISLNKDIIKDKRTNKLYILSDFQYNFFNKDIADEKELNLNLLPAQLSKTNNISVDSCWFDKPNRIYLNEEKLFVKIKSFSDDDLTDLPVKLYINDSLKAVSSINIDAGYEQKIFFNYTNSHKGLYNAKIEIEDYPISFDNSLFFSYNINEQINILCIGDEQNKYIKSVFETEDYFSYEFQNNNTIEYSKFKEYKAIILYGKPNLSTGLVSEIKKYVNKGGTFLLIPNTTKDYSDEYNNLNNSLKSYSFIDIDTSFAQINKIDNNIDLFNNLFENIDNKTVLPKINSYYTIQKNNNKTEEILNSQNNSPILIRTKFGKGNYYAFTFDAVSNNEGTFNKSPIFLPLLFNISLLNNANTLYYTIDGQQKIKYNKEYQSTINIKNEKFGVDFISQTINTGNNIYLNIDDYINNSGNYNIYENEKQIDLLSFNYNRSESEMDFISLADLKSFIENNNIKNWKIYNKSDEHLTQEIINSYGKQLWYYFVILALFFLALETIFIRLFKIK